MNMSLKYIVLKVIKYNIIPVDMLNRDNILLFIGGQMVITIIAG